jgi:low affinity Fe/Cu permease
MANDTETNPSTSSTRGVLQPSPDRDHHDMFGWFAAEIARLVGKPVSFLVVAAFVAAWAVTGPFFHFSDKWFLLINTVGTIITTLVVFLIQNTQNRDTLALQLKLAELILVMEGAESKMALAEDLSHEDLEQLKERLRQRADKSAEDDARR